MYTAKGTLIQCSYHLSGVQRASVVQACHHACLAFGSRCVGAIVKGAHTASSHIHAYMHACIHTRSRLLDLPLRVHLVQHLLTCMVQGFVRSYKSPHSIDRCPAHAVACLVGKRLVVTTTLPIELVHAGALESTPGAYFSLFLPQNYFLPFFFLFWLPPCTLSLIPEGASRERR